MCQVHALVARADGDVTTAEWSAGGPGLAACSDAVRGPRLKVMNPHARVVTATRAVEHESVAAPRQGDRATTFREAAAAVTTSEVPYRQGAMVGTK